MTQYIPKKWIQPINPQGITATLGWENPENAFDNNLSTYARCNSLTDYIEYNLGENIYINGIETVGNWVSSQAVATNFKVYSVDDNGVESFLCETSGQSNEATYYTHAYFETKMCKKLRFYITTTYNNAPSRTVAINIIGYTFTAVPNYKATKETIRKYYKYSTIPNTVITGSPMLEYGVIKNFTTSDYNQVNDFCNINDNIDYIVKFKTLDIQTLSIIIGTYHYISVEINAGNITSYNFKTADRDIICPIEADKWYYIKVNIDGSAKKLYYSLDGINWTLGNTITTDTTSTPSATPLRFGVGVTSNYGTGESWVSQQLFTGEIDLRECFIKKGNTILWSGTKVEEYGTLDPDIMFVGSPTIINGILSNTSSSNYVRLPKPFTPGNNTWEMFFEIKTPSTLTESSFIGNYGNTYQNSVEIGTRNGKFRLSLPKDGSNTHLVDVDGTYNVQTNKKYYIKLSFTGTQYILAYSLDNNTYVDDIAVTNDTPIYQAPESSLIGFNAWSSTGTVWEGTVTLNNCYIKIGNDIWWRGYSNRPDFNIETIGSIGVDGNLISDFSTSNYAMLSEVFNPRGNDFEIGIKFKTSPTFTVATDNRFLFHFCPTSSSRGFTIHIQANTTRIGSAISNSDDSGWIAGRIAYYENLQADTTYWIKAKRENNILYCSYSLDGINYTVNTSLTLDFDLPELVGSYVGVRYNPSGSVIYDVGTDISIDLSESYIKINNDYFWKGIRGYDFYKDVNAYKILAEESKIYYDELTFEPSLSLQEWTVPENITKVRVDCVASKGNDGNNAGGKGGRVQCDLTVTPGQTYYIVVGNIPEASSTASYNASDIRTSNIDGVTGSTSLASRVIVAGGGGSSGAGTASNIQGGDGGGLIGQAGPNGWSGGGQGGTQSSGGAHGVHVSGQLRGSNHGTDGEFGMGGTGTAAGGAGWYGGGAGFAGDYRSVGTQCAGGGGGSSYTDSTLCSNITHTQGYNNGKGYITISTLNGEHFYKDVTVYKAFEE